MQDISYNMYNLYYITYHNFFMNFIKYYTFHIISQVTKLQEALFCNKKKLKNYNFNYKDKK